MRRGGGELYAALPREIIPEVGSVFTFYVACGRACYMVCKHGDVFFVLQALARFVLNLSADMGL